MFGSAVRLEHVGDVALVEYHTWDVARSTVLLKRVLDLAVSALALVILAPLMLLILVAVRLEGQGPRMFVQWRAGRDGQPFRLYKFRTMVADAEQRLADVVSLDELAEPVFKLREDPRVTPLGRVLRRTSLDELPQLVNVVRGDMSLVGPRPEQLEVVARYRPEHMFRLEVKPGLTGPMQVYGRGELTMDERLAVERDYVENVSIGRDMRILLLTIGVVMRGNGAY
jgi:lipopolysaccharide/colanic/teichoic acid biosynthesis glycosyltransferase